MFDLQSLKNKPEKTSSRETTLIMRILFWSSNQSMEEVSNLLINLLIKQSFIHSFWFAKLQEQTLKDQLKRNKINYENLIF